MKPLKKTKKVPAYFTKGYNYVFRRKRSNNDLKENIIKKQAMGNIRSEQNNPEFVRRRKVSAERRTHKNRNKETWQEAKERSDQKLREEYEQMQVQKEQKQQEEINRLNEQYKEQPYNQEGLEIGIDKGSQLPFMRPISGRSSTPILPKDDYQTSFGYYSSNDNYSHHNDNNELFNIKIKEIKNEPIKMKKRTKINIHKKIRTYT